MPPATSALVTGATQGIGRATAFALGRAGYRVGVCARTARSRGRARRQPEGEGIDAAGAAPTWRRGRGEASRRPGRHGDRRDRRAGEQRRRAHRPPVRRAHAGGLGHHHGDQRPEPLPDDPGRASRACAGGARAPSSTSPAWPGGTDSSAAPPTPRPSTRCWASAAPSCSRCGRTTSGSIAICPGRVDTALLRDQPMLHADPTRILRPEDVADTILHALLLPARALVSELDIRPTNP